MAIREITSVPFIAPTEVGSEASCYIENNGEFRRMTLEGFKALLNDEGALAPYRTVKSNSTTHKVILSADVILGVKLAGIKVLVPYRESGYTSILLDSSWVEEGITNESSIQILVNVFPSPGVFYGGIVEIDVSGNYKATYMYDSEGNTLDTPQEVTSTFFGALDTPEFANTTYEVHSGSTVMDFYLSYFVAEYGRAADSKITYDRINELINKHDTDVAVLEGEIQAIVAPTGEAPSVAEVLNARTDVNGVVHTSLGDAIRGQINQLNDTLNDSVEEIDSAIENESAERQGVDNEILGELSQFSQEVGELHQSVNTFSGDLVSEIATREENDNDLYDRISALQGAVGSPLQASTVAGMTETSKIYVYTGSETGYTAGHWYYYLNGTWTDGGAYNSTAVQTDTTLSVSGKAADAKKVGDEVADLKTMDSNLVSSIAPAYNASSTYAVGEKVMYDGKLYECSTAITTAEAWNASHWSAITVSKYDTDFTDVKTAISELTSVRTVIPLGDTGNKYIALNVGVGNTVSLTPVTSSSSVWRYAVVECTPGQKVELNVTGGSTPRAYGFIDSNNKLLAVAEYGAFSGTVVAPANTAKLIVQDNSGTGTAYFVSAPGRVDALEAVVDSIEGEQGLLASAVTLVSDDAQCNAFFKELYLEGVDPNVTYKWYIAARNNASYGYHVGIAIDGTTTIVAYLTGITTEPNNPVVIPERNNSGITGYAILDWTALENGSNKTYNIPLHDNVKSVYNSPTIYAYLHQNEPEDILIAMPDKINAVVGDTLQLYYQGMFRCVNSYNYAVTLQCDVGAQYPRYYELTPTAANVGEHTLTVQLRDNNGNIVSNKNVTINVVAAPSSPASMKNIFCVGASCTQNGEWVGEFQRKLTEDYNLSNINFIGRMSVNGTKLEATGGYTWGRYTNASAALLYKFYFNEANLPSVVNVGDVYASNGHNYTIIEINIPTPDGGGYISCTSDGLPGGSSGTLTRVSGEGDATLTYYNYVTSGNPFVFNGAINLPQYMTDYCNGVSPDVVYTELFVNGTTAYNSNVISMMDAMKAFAQMFHAAYPNCMIALGMPYCPDEKGGTGKNYNASGNFSWQYGIKYTFMEYMKTIEGYLSDNGLDSYVTLVDWTNEFDSENDFKQTTKAVNVRSTQTEVFGVNGIHPSNIGYMQMADSAVRHFVAHFCQ